MRLIKNHTELNIMLPSMPYWCADANVLIHVDYEPASGSLAIRDVTIRDFDLCQWDRATRQYLTRCNVAPVDDDWEVVVAIRETARRKLDMDEVRNWYAKQCMEAV